MTFHRDDTNRAELDAWGGVYCVVAFHYPAQFLPMCCLLPATEANECPLNLEIGGITMSREENKALVRRVFEESWSKGNISVLDEFLDPDFVWHDTISTHRTHNTETYKGAISTINDVFPDFHFTIEDIIIAEGDRVVTRWTACGTQKRRFGGVSPTDKPLKIEGVTISRIVGGKIIEEWWFRELFITHLNPENSTEALLNHLESHS